MHLQAGEDGPETGSLQRAQKPRWKLPLRVFSPFLDRAKHCPQTRRGRPSPRATSARAVLEPARDDPLQLGHTLTDQRTMIVE